MSPLPFCHHYSILVAIKRMQLLRTSTSGIHLYTIRSKNIEEYGEFVSPTKSIIQRSKKMSHIEANASWALLVNWSIWYPWHHSASYQRFFIFNDGAKMNSYNPQIMQYIVCHWNPIDVNVNMFPMENINVLRAITNIIIIFFLNIYLMNIWKCVWGWSWCWWRKLKEMEINN